MNKKNLFIENIKYENLLKEAKSLVPSIESIIKELYNQVYKNDIEECINNHFGYDNNIEVYIYQNYDECLSLALALNDKIDYLYLNDFEINIDNILDKYTNISLFSNYIDSYCKTFKNIKDINSVNGIMLRVK